MTAPAGLGLGLGVGWRPELAATIHRRADLGFVEIVAEAFPTGRPLPLALRDLRRRGVAVVPHGVRLSLGGADRPDPYRLAALADLALRVDAPLVSEHVAFVRGGGVEAGNLLPVPRTRAALDVLVENVRLAMAALPVPLALEPIASFLEWPDQELDEASFLSELLDRTGALLLLDVANLYANAVNGGGDPVSLLDRLPLDRVAYVHVAGGVEEGRLYHDTHAHPVPAGVLVLVADLAQRAPIPGVMLERDRRFPTRAELDAELDAIRDASRFGQQLCAHLGPLRPKSAKTSTASAAGAEEFRARLAEQQGALVAALVGTGPAPPGFDSDRLGAAADALAEKRAGFKRP